MDAGSWAAVGCAATGGAAGSAAVDAADADADVPCSRDAIFSCCAMLACCSAKR